MYKKTMTMP